ncbi:MAG: hypothetical protein B5766_10715 [Candidatus Lumbricidophila eiseniae]|uniref:ABC transporter domain-containing protein n=1 Tax=Candidatus Lumbricidiphila eiseniae TaxID=1969409 RepID=A0A2A6FNR7_9MICO|nr:MAG: hypothetical protein B5766_10715 [Candidatus Lumbricidophila eiseniae]
MSQFVIVDRAHVEMNGVVLLSEVSFVLGAGRALAVTGANGSGKTTLLRVLASTVRPSGGSVLISDAVPDDKSPVFRKQVAALLGLPPFARNLTLREHMTLVATSWGYPLTVALERADEGLERFRIDRYGQRFPHELSSGQTQLFALALTLIRPMQLLLLDEPEQRLDVDRLGLVGGILRALVESGTTIIMASHNEELVHTVTDARLNLVEGGNVYRG